jgi:hypothetical protein
MNQFTSGIKFTAAKTAARTRSLPSQKPQISSSSTQINARDWILYQKINSTEFDLNSTNRVVILF